jgi:DNA-directed RNA polymerase subunit D
MDITVLKTEKKNYLSFLLEKSSVAFANSLRRVAIEEVPVMAVEWVEFKKNSSVLYDEVLAHRIGLVPLKTDLKSYNLPAECPCNGAGCAQCQLKFTLKAKGPVSVYASDIETTDPKVIPVYPKMLLTKLLKGQALECDMIATLGQGKEHTKWSPGQVYYKYRPTIKISKKGESFLECAKVCPQQVFDKKGDKLVINEKNLLNCHLCGACIDLSGGEVSVEKNVTDFVFYVESWGMLSAEDIIMNASKRLDIKFDDFTELFKKTKGEK